MMVDTRNKSYANKGKGGNPKTTFAPSSSSQQTNPQVTKGTQSQEVSTSSPSSSKYNILKQLATIKARCIFIGHGCHPRTTKHLKEFMEGKTSTIASVSEESNEEELYINKVVVNNPRIYVKNPPFYVSVKIMDKISHCCLIDGGSGPNVMSNIIMEELGLSCTNENSKSMLSYNSQQQVTIGEIKYVTLVLCAHPEIRTTYNIQVIDMSVSNYSIILGRDWTSIDWWVHFFGWITHVPPRGRT
jgi:hypothetical protein